MFVFGILQNSVIICIYPQIKKYTKDIIVTAHTKDQEKRSAE
jgi:hypothetical protein